MADRVAPYGISALVTGGRPAAAQVVEDPELIAVLEGKAAKSTPAVVEDPDLIATLERKAQSLREKYKTQIRAAAEGGGKSFLGNLVEAVTGGKPLNLDTVREANEKAKAPAYEDGAPIPGFMGLLQRKMSDPFGVQDELVGGGRYVGSLAGDLIHGRAPDTGAANRAYAEGAERVRAEQEVARERLGWGGNLAAEVVGGFGTSGAGSIVNRAANWGARALQSAKAGAQYGAIAGAGRAEGGILDRLGGAALGAGEGAVIAPALSEVGFPVANALYQAVRKSPSAAATAFQTIIPGTRINVDKRLLQALDRQNMTPADLAAWEASNQAAATFGKTTMDIPYTLADSGPAMQQLGYNVASQPGKGAVEARRVLEGRQRGQGGFTSQSARMDEATQRTLRVTRDNAARAEDKLTTGRTEESRKAFDEFRAWDGVIPVDDILQGHAAEMASKLTTGSKLFHEIERAYAPFVDEAHALGTVQGPSVLETARYNLARSQLGKKIAKAGEAGDVDAVRNLMNLQDGLKQQYAAKTKDVNLTAPSNELTPIKFDAAMKQLGDAITEAEAKQQSYKVGLLTDLKKALQQRADALTTVQGPEGPRSLYAESRKAYATPSQLLDAQAAGKKFENVHPDRLGAEYRALNTPQRRQYRVGMADSLGMKYGDAGFGHNVTKVLDTPNMQNRLGEVMSGKNRDKLNAIAKLEADMHATRQRNLYGSRTDENQQWRTDFTMGQRFGRNLKEGKYISAVVDPIVSTLSKVYRLREQDARLLARDVFAVDPAQRMATIQRLEKAYGTRVARAAISEAVRLAERAMSRFAVPEAVEYINDLARPRGVNALAQAAGR